MKKQTKQQKNKIQKQNEGDERIPVEIIQPWSTFVMRTKLPKVVFDKMLEKFSNTIMMQAQEALRQQWHLLQQSSQVQQQAHQQQALCNQWQDWGQDMGI